MLHEAPTALDLADSLECEAPIMSSIVAMLRTQHAAIERKDALLKQVLAAYEQDEGLAMGRVIDLITKELQ